MSIRKESRSEAYDCIVVGSGMGGLSAAALLARAGRRVLVVERHDRAGGYAHAFKRRKYVFDAAVHLVGGCEPVAMENAGLIDGLLRVLRVRDRCEFIRVDPFYVSSLPGLRIEAPLGRDAFVAAHAREFPAERAGIAKLLELCGRIRSETARLPGHLTLLDYVRMPRRFPTLAKYHKATLGQVMDELLHDRRLKAALASLWPYLGLPPSRLSFVYWSMMLSSYVDEGAYYCRGSFQNLADAFVAALEAHGGELLLNSPVRRITVDNKRASGVVLENGQRIAAPVVISNADATATFDGLVGTEHVPGRYLRKLHAMRPSVSAFVLYTATDLDLRAAGAAHEMFFYDTVDHENEYRLLCEGRPAARLITVPTIVDPSLAPDGEHLVVVTTLVPYQAGASWREEKARRAEQLMGEVDRFFPGFAKHVTFAEGASPRTMERYTLNLTGAIYGWEVSPSQVGPSRLANETPIDGLYLSGHWARPGGGIYAVVASGLQTAASVLGHAHAGALLEDLGVGAALGEAVGT